MNINIHAIKFDFKLHYRDREGFYGISAYFNNDIQLYELLDESGKLFTTHTRRLTQNDTKVKELKHFYKLNDSDITSIIEQFDAQASAFLEKNKFLQKQNLIVRYKKNDVLHDVELEIINENKQTGEYVRDLISKGYDYQDKNDLTKEIIKNRTPYLIMSYEEIISRNERNLYDPWLFTLTGKSYFTLFNFIITRSDRWEFDDGNLYIPTYKFLEQTGLYKVTFHLENGIDEDTYYNEMNNSEFREEFKEYLLQKKVITEQSFNFSHPYMENSNFGADTVICLNLIKFKELICVQLATLLYIDEGSVFKFNFLAEAKINGYADKIPAFFTNEDEFSMFVRENAKLAT